MKLPKDCRKRVKRWVKALRSGEYAQGRGNLCKWVKDDGGPETGHWELCALGVYYDVNVEGEWRASWPVDAEVVAELAPGVMLAYGMSLDVYLEGGEACLAQIDTGAVMLRNDNSGWTFDQIADWLEQEYLAKGAKS